MSRRCAVQTDPLGEPLPDEILSKLISLGRQLMAKSAKTNFHLITSVPGWTIAQVDAGMRLALRQMESSSWDRLAAIGVEPSSGWWREILTAMEDEYRTTTNKLLLAAGLRIGATLQ